MSAGIPLSIVADAIELVQHERHALLKLYMHGEDGALEGVVIVAGREMAPQVLKAVNALYDRSPPASER